MLFTEKYKPKSLNDIKGQDKAVKSMLDFIKSKKKKCAVIYGPAGTGKTSSVYALAHELDLEILEVNASDFRDADSVKSIIGSAAKQMSLFSKGKIILVDEVDGLSGREDRGGIPELVRIIDETSFPLICTASDVFDNKFSSLRKKSLMVGFEPISPDAVYDILKAVCNKEKIEYNEEDLKQLARQSGGDIRAAIIDLQTISSDANKVVKEDVLELTQRNRQESVPQALAKIFKSSDMKVALTAFDNIDEDLDKIKLWVDENLPYEYKKPEDLARAYHYVSKADIFNRRIRRWQHWRFLVYINNFLSGGISVSKDEKYKDFVQYKPTMRILKLWMANQKFAKRKAIAEKIHSKLHASLKETVKSTVPYLQVIFKSNKEEGVNITQELALDDEETEWLSR